MEVYDILIVGSGPAGLSAAIYAGRALLNCAVLEMEAISGGQVISTTDIDNYPGFPDIDGFDLADKMKKHAESAGAAFITDKVLEIKTVEIGFEVKCEKSTYLARCVILAAGARHRMLKVDGEERLRGRGVSYCATCDGAFFRNKTVAVIGGGNTAAEDALYLSRLCKKVYLIHRRDTLRAGKGLTKKVMAMPNIEPLWNTQVTSVEGDLQVSGVKLNDGKVLDVDGVFIAIGMQPNSEAFKEILETDELGFIVADETGATSVSGIFAAGDIRTKALRQIVTAAADGANAVAAAEKFLMENE